MDVTQAAVQAATDALLRVIDRLLIAGAVSQFLLAFAIYFLVLALVRAHRGGGSGTIVVPAQPTDPVTPPIIITPPIIVPPASRPDISLGASGSAVVELQQILGVDVDGQFGDDTDAAVRTYQATHGLEVDGEVGPDTWAALLSNKPAVVPTSANIVLSADTIAKIVQSASSSSLAHYSWSGRGTAPAGYVTGIAVAFGNVYAKWKQGNSSTLIMAQAAGSPSSDALAWFDAMFSSIGLSNKVPGADTLRHLFVLLTGLGMRESSGNCFEGRDVSASNTTADTAEAGLFQQSWNSNTASPELPKLFAQWSANPSDFLSIFAVGVHSTAAGLTNYGSGQGAAFQALCKSCPAFAVEMAAVGLRVLRSHWGPIVRQEAQVRPEADQLFQQVQAIVDAASVAPSSPGEVPPVAPPSPTPTPIPPVVAPVSGVPPQLAVMRDLVARGVHATHDNPEIMTWPGFISMKFSNVAGLGAYCAGYVHDSIAWCGLTMAYCMAKAGIMPAFTNGDDLKSFLWAFGWMDSGWGTTIWRWDQGIPISQATPQMGDIMVFDWSYTGGDRTNPGQGHVTMYDHLSPNDDLFWCSGGNQSNHLCSTSGMAMKNCVAILRPLVPSV